MLAAGFTEELQAEVVARKSNLLLIPLEALSGAAPA